ncbi:MAG TPA: hypothetical protein VJ839_01685 [Candidatus Limnocylindria bacterium]|nr:hypothetical protein [Candidatus Limnocylindria bacterium]
MGARSTWLLLGLLTLVSACSAATSPSVSLQPSASPSEAAVSGLPPGCEPHEVRGPDGERIDLDGTWVEEVGEDEAPMTWWIRTQGDCVWGAGTVDDVPADGASIPDTVQTIRGRLGSDLIIDGEILRLGPYASSDAARAIYSPIRLKVDFDDDGQVVLREDRVYGVAGPRCGDPVVFCIPVLVLRPAH